MIADKKTDELDRILKDVSPERVDAYFRENEAFLTETERPFTAYMRTVYKEKGLKQQEVFRAADISEGYGYKLIAQESLTRQRDVILRLCLAGHFSLEETNRALKLYGMSPLYAKVRRDAVLIITVNQRRYRIEDVNELLRHWGQEELYSCRENE